MSEEGKARCEVLARELAALSPAVVVSSEEMKAEETGRIVAEELGVPHHSAPDLHEHDRSNVPQLRSAEFISMMELLFRRPGELVLGKETAVAALSRFRSALDEVLAEHAEGNVAVVSHGTVIALLLEKLDPKRKGFRSVAGDEAAVVRGDRAAGDGGGAGGERGGCGRGAVMNEEASSGRTVLGYEGTPVPPCVVRSPGRVALLMPPPPRWAVTGSVLILAAVWVGTMGMSLWLLVKMLRGPVWLNVVPAGVFLGMAPLVLTSIFAGAVTWWARSSRRGTVLELVGNELMYSTPGMLWGNRSWRAPTSRVKAVEVRAVKSLVRSRVLRVDVRAKLHGWWPGPWHHFTRPTLRLRRRRRQRSRKHLRAAAMKVDGIYLTRLPVLC